MTEPMTEEQIFDAFFGLYASIVIVMAMVAAYLWWASSDVRKELIERWRAWRAVRRYQRRPVVSPRWLHEYRVREAEQKAGIR